MQKRKLYNKIFYYSTIITFSLGYVLFRFGVFNDSNTILKYISYVLLGSIIFMFLSLSYLMVSILKNEGFMKFFDSESKLIKFPLFTILITILAIELGRFLGELI